MRPDKISFAFLVFLAAAGLLLLLPACIGKSAPRPRIEYYTLDYDPPSRLRETPLPYILSIEPLTAVPPYNSNRIIYKKGSHTGNFYTYHLWITPPADMVTYFLSRDLRTANIVSAVNLSGFYSPTHRLQGFVEQFYEQDLDDRWNAVISMTMTLIKENEPDPARKICLQNNYHARTPLEQNNPNGLAQSMSIGLSRISQEIAADLERQLQTDYSLQR